ncbi:MAG: Hpt domain-containing protein [Thermogutta sp.]|nr:Hpt domain-containing protein [Thermogutta sp.]
MSCAAGQREPAASKVGVEEKPLDKSLPTPCGAAQRQETSQSETEATFQAEIVAGEEGVQARTPAGAASDTTLADGPAPSPSETETTGSMAQMVTGSEQSGTQQNQRGSDDFDFETANCVEPPTEVDHHLWQTFLQELHHRSQVLRRSVTELRKQESLNLLSNFDTVVELARTLHTIKSAAMVVPVEVVVRVTHSLESLLEAATRSDISWDITVLDRYCNWLDLFLNCAGLSWADLNEVGENLLHDLQQMIPAEAPGTTVQQ